MTSSTTRAFMAKKQSTSFAQVATNLLNVLQGYTKGIRFVLVLSFLFTLSVGSMWGADGDVLYTLSFTKLSTGDNFNNYGNAHTITVSSKTWSVTGNQSLGNFLGVGGRGGENTDREISSISPIGSKVVKKVIITNDGTGGNGTITLNSIKLEVASNSNFSTIVDTKTISSPTKSGEIEFIPTSPLTVWPENSYYRITYNYNNTTTTKNGYVKVNSVVFYEGATTITCGSKVTINATNDGYGTITAIPTSIETCSDNDEDREITITLNPNQHYSSNTPVISGIANATITGSGNTYTVQLPKSSNGTLNISATFKEDEKYTVTWSADGTPIKTQEVYVNEQVSEVPTSSDIPEENRCGDKFVGWTTEAIPTPQDDAPGYFTTAANSPTIIGDITFYAVFADYEQ